MTDEQNIIQVIKKHLPNYKVYDATNKNSKELFKISNICENVSNLIVFCEYKDNNKQFFDHYRNKYNILEQLTILFLYNGNIRTFDDPNYKDKIEGIVRAVSDSINHKDAYGKCVICLEEKQETIVCGICGAVCCEECLLNTLYKTNKHVNCPICRSYMLTFTK